MRNYLVLCIFLAVQSNIPWIHRGLADFKGMFFQKVKPNGRKIMRPSHGLVIILSLFVIFGLPDPIHGNDTESDASTTPTPLPTVISSTNDDNNTVTNSSAAPTISTTTTTTLAPTPSSSSPAPITTPTPSKNATGTFLTFIFTGNFNIDELSKLLQGGIINVEVHSTVAAGLDTKINFTKDFQRFNGTSMQNEMKDDGGKYHATVAFVTTSPQITPNSTEVPPTTTTTTMPSTSTTEKPLPPSATSKKVLLFLCLAMMVILIVLIAYRCLTVDSCWYDFKAYCFPRTRRVVRVTTLGLDPITSRLLSNENAPAHSDYPRDAEQYERL